MKRKMNINDKVVRYARLATENLRQTGSNEPTEEMSRLGSELNMPHNQIIERAAELTRRK